jgi:hypothetical protein
MKAQEAVKGLTLEELEGQRAELLPDRASRCTGV